MRTARREQSKLGRTPGPSVLDVFSGAGGMSRGFERAGFNIVCGIDNWPDALQTFSKNHQRAAVRDVDLSAQDAADSADAFIGVDVVIGGPPCQGYSIAGKRDVSDPRNRLFSAFADIVRVVRPRAFVLENVPNLASMDSGRFLDEMRATFTSLGFELSDSVLLAANFGVPQNRRRFFMVGVRAPFRQFVFPSRALSPATITLDAISDLPEGSLADGSPYPKAVSSDYQAHMRRGSKGVWNHQVTDHKEKTRSTIALVPDGGNYKDLPPELRYTRRVNIAWTRHPSSRPSYTIDTGHRHHFHYRYNRVPTVRESARLQSFEDSFRFTGSRTSQYRQVGNAVPPLLAESVALKLGTALGV